MSKSQMVSKELAMEMRPFSAHRMSPADLARLLGQLWKIVRNNYLSETTLRALQQDRELPKAESRTQSIFHFAI
jgi:hypothetical protein